VWGLPAASLADGESEDDAVRRAAREKLGVEVRALGIVGTDGPMTDVRAEIASGEPSVPQAGTGTQYSELRWGEPGDLIPAARLGSHCSRALLRAHGLGWDG
jgi:hypothetical protein